jgi:hypothetical protein
MINIPQKINRITGGLILVASFFGLSLLFAHVSSAQSGSGQALEISPPVLNLTADPGETVKARVLIRNIAKTDLVVTGEANDFVAEGESGTPKVLLEPGETSPYSMKEWIAAPAKLNLVPKEIKSMDITINVPNDASPGGHYSVIRFTGTPPNLEGQGVSLSASLGSLIFMRVSGDITENMSIEQFDISKNSKAGTFFESPPLTFTERIKNSGNIHEQPGGAVTITNMFNKPVATFSYNPDSRRILPGSTRKFEQTVDNKELGGKRLFGKYTAKLTVTYGDKNSKTTTSTVTFWIIPWKIIAIIIGVLIAGFFLLRYAIKRYNRAVVKRANRR